MDLVEHIGALVDTVGVVAAAAVVEVEVVVVVVVVAAVVVLVIELVGSTGKIRQNKFYTLDQLDRDKFAVEQHDNFIIM